MLRSVFKGRNGGKIFPPEPFVAECVARHAAAVFLFQLLDIARKNAGRRHAMADEIDRQQLVRLLIAQRRQQAVDLTGRTGKQHGNIPPEQ